MELIGVLIGVLLAVPVILLLERSSKRPDWYEVEAERIVKALKEQE